MVRLVEESLTFVLVNCFVLLFVWDTLHSTFGSWLDSILLHSFLYTPYSPLNILNFWSLLILDGV
jgi:hypothetical protein